ncbi:MAG TPA: FAD-dependent oxidoreductase [Thermoleophilaceae bacterium]|nr:FAD-dependent oxidoreductase [Thermoleophilaceae bacterium]
MTAGTTPFWLDAPYEPRPALDRDLEVEACVIGGGVGGLSCARRLAENGVETVLLEAGTVAGGASGRNGGFLITGVALFHNDARERLGAERASAMYAATLEAQREVIALAQELGAGDAVRQIGLIRLAVSEEEAEHVRDHAAALREDGFPGETIERADLPPALQRIGLVGCLTAHDCALHPARWYRLLAAAAERAGARIYEGTRVSGPVAAPGEGPVITSNGLVKAASVVVAADGALPVLVPEYAGRVRSRRLHMVATAPVPPAIETMVYARWGFEYLQQRLDGRILVGGFSDVDADDSYTDSDAGSPLIWERVERYLREDLGVQPEITHRWAGVVGYSDDSLPYVGEVPGRDGLYVSGGYSGVGNVPGFMCGRDIADAIAGRGREILFPADREPWTDPAAAA